MTSKAESAAAAVYTALASPTMTAVPTARVFRDLNDALRTNLLPAVVVETGDERAPEAVLIGRKDRFVEVNVTILATSFTSADAAVVESFGRIFADRTLGGAALDIDEGPTTRDRAGGADDTVAVRKTYVVHCRTTEASLES